MGPWVAPAVMAGVGTIGSMFGGNKGGGGGAAVLETPEQAEARRYLLELAKGNLSYGGKLGSYAMTRTEGEGQNQLMRLLGSTRPEAFGIGEKALKDLYGGTFDPYNDGGSFKGFRTSVLREGDEAVNRLKRSATMAGNLYSTDTIKRLGDVEGDTVRALTGELGRLYDNFTERKINAIPTAFAAGQAQETLDLGRVDAAMRYGNLPRLLEDQEYKDAYNEFVRAQSAKIGAVGSVAGQPHYQTFQNEGSDPWSRVLEMLAYGGGAGLGTYFASKG